MKSAIFSLSLALFTASSVVAHPTRVHLAKRAVPDGARRVGEWTDGNAKYEEYEVVKTVVLQPGETPPPSKVESAPPVVTVTQAAGPKVNSKLEAPVVAQPEPVASPAPAAAAANAASDGTCSGNTIGGDASAWATNPCSDGKTIVDSFNKLRAAWIPGLASSPYTWDATLAANARLTTVSPVTVDGAGRHNEGGATEMNHMLYPGSMGQVIASGDGTTVSSDGLSPFESALKLWLCEIPQGNIGCTSPTNGGDTGHADIIKSTTYTKVGCYYMDAQGPASWKGEWTCDFA